MKSKSAGILALLLVVAVGLGALSYFGVDVGKKKDLFGIHGISLGLDLSGGVYIVYEAEKDAPTADEMNSAVSLIQGRLDRKGYTEAEVAKEGTKRIRVEIPGIEEVQTAIEEIGRTAQLSFTDESGKVLVSGDQVANATKSMITDRSGVSKVVVNLEFTTLGKQAFAEATRNNLNKPINIVLDNNVISAPTVNSEITDGKAYIEGSFDAASAEELAALIRAGSLPFNLKILEMNNVGARLGTDSLQTSILAGIVGFVLVLLFMLSMYRMLGAAASWALVIYVELLLIILSLCHVTLTLPGIAGIILSIGMAVDANIIIFERMKDELNNGRTIRSALVNGFARAFPPIFDSNVTTIIAGVVLFWLGTGPIKGFAQTLIIGIVLSMFTALIVTRIIITSLLGVGVDNPKLFGRK